MITDLRILELLASKICHDLVSPVGAINNGVELIEDIGGDVVDEAMQLIRNSAEQAARRLRLFRIAYGRAGADSNLTFKDAQETLHNHFEHGKIRLHFAPNFPPETFLGNRGALKHLLNLALLAEEVLIYGGDLHFSNGGDDCVGGIVLTASGRSAALNEATLAALQGTAVVEAVTPRTVHAYVTGQFIALYNFHLTESAPAAETVQLQLKPAAALST